jgi:EAL domain-containing protein (putative c-di-GMP-specific phosphodiesterase class I)
MSQVFLRTYLNERDAKQSVSSGSTIVREPAFLPPHPLWQARIGLAVLLNDYNYRNYENEISKKIAAGIDEIIVSMELSERNLMENQKKGEYETEFSKSNHRNTTGLLRGMAEIIMIAYDGVFDVSIERANQHRPRMGDFRVTNEVPIGYGYTAIIEYPLENAGMVEHEYEPGTRCPSDIYKLFTGVVARQLREFIIRISNPKVLSQFLSPAEKLIQEQLKKDTSGYIDLNQYALFHEIFVERSGDVKPLIFHQKKYRHGQLVGSEILVRFQDPDSDREKLLPLQEAFAYLDLFEQYKVVSRRILSNAIEEAVSLEKPFSLNIKCEELMDPDFSEFLIGNMTRVKRVNGHGITLEILESSALNSEDANILKNLKILKMHGFHFALDDFRGTDEDYDKFNKLRAIHIPQSAINDFDGRKSQHMEYLDIADINDPTFLESNISPFDEEPKNASIPIFGKGDEVKFDYTNKETLQMIHDITKDWPE